MGLLNDRMLKKVRAEMDIRFTEIARQVEEEKNKILLSKMDEWEGKVKATLKSIIKDELTLLIRAEIKKQGGRNE